MNIIYKIFSLIILKVVIDQLVDYFISHDIRKLFLAVLDRIMKFFISIASGKVFYREEEVVYNSVDLDTRVNLNTQEISILTLNTHLILDSASPMIAFCIAKHLLDIDADIVCLQEVFDNDCRDVFVEELKGVYPNWVSRSGKGAYWNLGLGSGLMLFSKFPITKVHFEKYHVADISSADYLANKGFLYAQLFIDNNKVNLFNTHLQSGIERSMACWAAYYQLMQMLNYYRREIDSEETTIFAGDFNFEECNGELYNQIIEKGFTDSDYQQKRMTIDDNSKRIDYIFHSNNSIFTVEEVTINKINCLSDHYAVINKLTL